MQVDKQVSGNFSPFFFEENLVYIVWKLFATFAVHQCSAT